MNRILAIIFLLLALFGYLDQEIRLNTSWDWPTFWHHENLVLVSLAVGLSFLTASYNVERVVRCILAWILVRFGNVCFRLNGNLAGLHNKSRLNRLMYVFWGSAYGLDDEGPPEDD